MTKFYLHSVLRSGRVYHFSGHSPGLHSLQSCKDDQQKDNTPMKRQYSYVPLAYADDRTAGEYLNIGVLVHTKDRIVLAVNSNHARLSVAFSGFDGLQFARVTDALFRWAAEKAAKMKASSNACEAMRILWPDNGLSYHVVADRMFHGIAMSDQDLEDDAIAILSRLCGGEANFDSLGAFL